MSKRMTDTDLWDKEWFMALTPRIKCAVEAIRAKCDLAGVWSPNWPLLNTYINDPKKVTETEILKIDSGAQFAKMPDGKIFCVGFVEFQNGTLGDSSPIHKKIKGLLKIHQIEFNQKIGYLYPKNRTIVGVEGIVEVGEEKKKE